MSATKKMDAKQFFLNYGDRLALAAAIVTAVFIAFWGLRHLGPSDLTEAQMKKNQQAAANNLNSGRSGDIQVEGLAAEKGALLRAASIVAEYNVAHGKHVGTFAFSEKAPPIENLRVNPPVLAPTQLAAEPFRAAFTVYDVRDEHVLTVHVKDRSKLLGKEPPDPKKDWEGYQRYVYEKRQEEYRKRLQENRNSGGVSNPGGNPFGPPGPRERPGGPGGRPGGMPGDPGGKPGGMPPGGGRFPGGISGPGQFGTDQEDTKDFQQREFHGKLTKIEELTENDSIAVTIFPIQGAYIVGSFPLKEQMEVLRKSLRLGPNEQGPLFPTLIKELEIQRREIVRRGTRLPNREIAPMDFVWIYPEDNERRKMVPLDGLEEDIRYPESAGWVDVNLRESSMPLRSALQWQHETDNIMYWIQSASGRMLMKLPKLERGQYPDPVKRLSQIAQVYSRARQQYEVKPSGPPIDPRLVPKGDDDPFGPTPGPNAMMPGRTPPPSVGGPEKQPPKDPTASQWPDYTLLRFLDLDPRLLPGKTYEYRVRIVIRNPNARLHDAVADPGDADIEELRSPWSTTTRVDLPEDLHLYADRREAQKSSAFAEDDGRAPVQIHKWLGAFRTGVGGSRTLERLAEWYIHRTTAGRGEFIARFEKLPKMIVWDPTQPASTEAHRFGTDVIVDNVVTDAFYTGRLLVDYEHGGTANKLLKRKFTNAEDNVPVELLVVEPDGRLVLHSAARSREDKEREDRFTRWEAWFKEVEARTAKTSTDKDKDKDKDKPR